MTLPILEVRGRTRGGRPFLPVLESSLDGPIREIAMRLPGAKNGLVLGAEFVGSLGVVDLLAVAGVGNGFELRERLSVPFLDTEADAAVVAVTYESATRTPKWIAEQAGMSLAQVERRVRDLEAKGFLLREGSGYRRRGGLAPVGRAYAIEAKVSDWRRGLAQALRYSSWCDAAGVVLLQPPSSIDAAQERYRAFGIGLAVRDRWLVRPRLGTPNRARRLLLSERVASAYRDQGVVSSPSSEA